MKNCQETAGRPVESHPFPPLLPPEARVLLMGTFPPRPEKHAMDFHYPNFNNDLWRVMGAVFFNDPAHFIAADRKRFSAEAIKTFLRHQGIGLCPTVLKAIRLQNNAADRFLQVVEAVDLAAVLAQLPHCQYLGLTSGKAVEILLEQQGGGLKMPKTNETIAFPFAGRDLMLTRLPSTSRAYPLALTAKIAAYRDFFRRVFPALLG